MSQQHDNKSFMRTSLALMTVCSALLAVNPAFAADKATSPFSKLKPMTPIGSSGKERAPNYLGASMGAVDSKFCDTLQDCDTQGKSWKAFAGVRLNDNVVLEGGYANLGKQQGQDSAGYGVAHDVSAVTLSSVIGFPMNDQIELFGKAGIARWSAEHNHSLNGSTETRGTDMMIGAGASYDLGDNLGVRAEWERYKDIGTVDDQQVDMDMLSVGVTFSSL